MLDNVPSRLSRLLRLCYHATVKEKRIWTLPCRCCSAWITVEPCYSNVATNTKVASLYPILVITIYSLQANIRNILLRYIQKCIMYRLTLISFPMHYIHIIYVEVRLHYIRFVRKRLHLFDEFMMTWCRNNPTFSELQVLCDWQVELAFALPNRLTKCAFQHSKFCQVHCITIR